MKSKQDLIKKWEGAIESADFYGKGKEDKLIEYMQNFIDDLDQLDEPEITKKQAYEKIAETLPINIEQLRNHIEKMVAHGGHVTYGEAETLSQEWIDRNKFEVNNWNEAVHVEDLQNLLVPKDNTQEQWRELTEFLVNERVFGHEDRDYLVVEKPVIPQFVADYIKWYKKDFVHRFSTDAEYIISLLEVPFEFMGFARVQEWRDKSGNAQKLIDAYRFGYEIEEEPESVIKISENLYLAEPLGDTSGNRIEVTRGKKDAYRFKDKQSIKTHLSKFSGAEVEELEE